jgi:hypothetical protein
MCVLLWAMSGVKRNRDLRRKFNPVHLKEKSKVKLERKNLELSGSLLKVFKRNGVASASNKDLGRNKSGKPAESKCCFCDDEVVRQCMKTAEVTRLKGPSSLKDPVASDLAVEHQQKTLEKMSESLRLENSKPHSESCDCESEKNCICFDKGEWTVPLSEALN